MRTRPLTASLCLAALALAAPAAAQTKLLRLPDIHGERVVFTYAGDLWLAPAAGGAATRLTAHPGLELFAKFSPDGRSIAFTGQYDGDEQVYVVPAAGGVPKQLTYYPARGPLNPRWGYDNQVMGWTPDGAAVLFRSLRDGWGLADSRLYTVPAAGGLGEPLPMPISGAGDLSPDGKRIVYTPNARDFRTWKRYQGGWQQDLWVFELASHDARKLTDHPRSDRDPMWIGDTVYFSSDRSGTLNLYAQDLAAGPVRQLTQSRQWDVRWPSSDNKGRIVYEQNGELVVFDVASGASRPISIAVPTDGLYNRPSQVSAAEQIEGAALSPKGERAVFVARGDVFTVPIEKGVTRNLTGSSNAHDKWARWSPDGRKIAYISDASGEDEVWIRNQDGSGTAEQLTRGGKAMRHQLDWAPDGKRISFGDKDGKLWVLTLADKSLVEVYDDPVREIRDQTWSWDGGHLAWSGNDVTGWRSLWIWSAADGKTRRVTGEVFDEVEPVWDPKGNYLYYFSARGYAPQFDTVDFNWAVERNEGIYALALRRDVPHPFPPESDEVTVEKEGEKKDGEKKDDKAKKPDGYIKIDFDGLADRVARVPVPFEDYNGLYAVEGRLVYTKLPGFFLGREPGPVPAMLQVFNFEDRKETTLAEKVDNYAISADGKKVLVSQEGQWNLYEIEKGKDSKKTVSTAGLVVDRDPAQEWAQIFDEAWRRFRDFFYVENMHGYDWEALGRQYRPLLAHVGHRSDLNYLIGEMIAELNVSHAYIEAGDFALPERPKVALPGARFDFDEKAGRYRITKIFRGHNEEETYRAPLTEIGVDARVGDYVLAIDGVELLAGDNPYRLLRHKADRPVRLTLNDRPVREGAREVTFQPLASEEDLLYFEWVEGNRKRVKEMTGGRVAYLHLPDMGEGGMREFIKWWYGQWRKEGMVIDVRRNGGGFISQTLLERIGRKALSLDFGRLSDLPQTYPFFAFHGHMVCLIDENSGSDGDIFPAMFKQAGMGPLIGKRTWGGVVGISGRGPLIDGGRVFVPEAGSASVAGEWIIEGHGVDPDIEVQNDPKSLLAGRDPQLERAVAEVLQKMEAEPRRLPKKPAGPIKTP
ncbi:MAG TPA: S41 family peptidase [Thermoanaerobaculia bacterium]|nr:S41 family peptidase [Thermoanaerobaculia bacterium]